MAILDLVLTLLMAVVTVGLSFRIERHPTAREYHWWPIPKFRSKLKPGPIVLIMAVVAIAALSVIVKYSANKQSNVRREVQLQSISGKSSDIELAVNKAHQLLDEHGNRLREATDSLKTLQAQAKTELSLLTDANASLQHTIRAQRVMALKTLSDYTGELRENRRHKMLEAGEDAIQVACEILGAKLEHIAANSVLEAETGRFPEHNRELARKVINDAKSSVENFINASSNVARENTDFRQLLAVATQLDTILEALSRKNLTAVEVRDGVFYAREALVIFSFHARNLWRGGEIKMIETVLNSLDFQNLERMLDQNVKDLTLDAPSTGH